MKSRIKLSRRVATAMVAVVVVVGIGAFVLLDLIFANQLTPARASSLLTKASPLLAAVLKKDFNSDYSRIVKATIASEKELNDGMIIAKFLDDETRPITVRLADVARRAPPDKVADWMAKVADAMDAIQSIAGPQLCSQYINNGQSALTDSAIREKLAPAFDARDAAFFAALAGARKAPESSGVGPATQADWEAVDAAMNGLEVPVGYAQIVKEDNERNQDYCSALAYFYRIVEKLPGKAGERIRAEYFVRSFS